jgi:hypothetical protein
MGGSKPDLRDCLAKSKTPVSMTAHNGMVLVLSNKSYKNC